MNAKHTCSSCGAELPADAPSGLCVSCLLKSALPPTEPPGKPSGSPQATIRISLPTSADEPPTSGEQPGGRIGRYKLLQEIGEGGMGTVWMAEQEEPVRRKVALKVIKLGMDTKQVIGRFEAERQALALMDHPNIAKVLDAGATENGRPFFVMELVKGIPITKYCDDKKVATKERLELFIEVCRAVQHAHQKGIIHRDISPSNILVTNHDGKPVPKVIDFGIAKATDQKLTDKTVFTALGQFIGKPAYMSPEQAEMNALDVDTRTDIYSLGVLLYELLTGKTPFDAKELISAGLEGMRKMIQEKEPVRPSTRISSLENVEQTTVATQRQSEPPKLVHLVRGDLDWVAMKCLEKDRTRRYETANGLAADVERHLKNEPVVARPPSNIYRFQKFARRNKLAFTAVAVVLFVLVLGIVVSTWQAVRATRAELEQTRLRTAAENAQKNETKLRKQAEAAEQSARLEAKRAEDAVLETKSTSANSDFVQGVRLIAEGRNEEAMAFLSRSLSLKPTNNPAATRLVTLLSSKSWLIPSLHLGGSKRIIAAEFSRDAKRIAVGASDGTARVYDANSGQLLTELGTHASAVYSLQFSPDGKRIVSGSSDKTAQVWDSVTGQALTGPMTHRYPVRLVRFSSDGERLITADGNNPVMLRSVQVWDVKTGKPRIEPVSLGTNSFRLLELSPDGSMLAIVGAKTTQVWDLQDGTLKNELNGQALAAYFSSDRNCLLARQGSTGSLRVLNALTSDFIAELTGHSSFVSSAQFSPDGEFVVTASRDQTVRLWNSQTGQPVAGTLNVNLGIAQPHLCFSPDSRMVLFAVVDDKMRVWNVRTGELVSEPRLHKPFLSTISISSDSKSIVAAALNSGACVWSMSMRQAVPLKLAHEAYVRLTRFSPDGSHVVAVLLDNTVQVWDAVTGRKNNGFIQHRGPINSIEFSRDGGKILTASDDRTAAEWDSQSYAPSFPPLKHEGRVFSAQYSFDGKRIVTASEDKTVRIWDATSGAPLSRDFTHEDMVLSARFSPDDTQIVTLSADSTIRLWDLRTGQFKQAILAFDRNITNSLRRLNRNPETERFLEPQFRPDGKQIMTGVRTIWGSMGIYVFHETPTNLARDFILEGRTAQYCNDGKWIATASPKGARVFDAGSGELIAGFLEITNSVQSVELSPNGSQMATVTSKGEAQVWDVLTGQLLADVTSQDGRVSSIQFSPDGRRLITISTDFSARIWDIAPVSTESPAWLSRIAEALSGQAFNKQGVLQQSKLDPVELLSQVRQEMDNSPTNNDWAIWGRWFLAKDSARMISPFTKANVSEYVEDRIREGTAESLDLAEKLAVGNSSLLARVSAALKAREERFGINNYGSQRQPLPVNPKKEPSPDESVRSSFKAAEQGNAHAQYVVGWGHETGTGVKKDIPEALKWYRKAAERGSSYSQSRLIALLSTSPERKPEMEEALKWATRAAERGDSSALNQVAWRLATASNPQMRNGPAAVAWAEKAVATTHRKNAQSLDTLAAAYAESGDFAQAVVVEKEAIKLVADEGLLETFKSRLILYESGQPYHEPTSPEENLAEKYAYHAGYFGKLANTARWLERSGQHIYHFQELKRDTEVILLRDATRKFRIQIPIDGGMSTLSPDDGATWQNLYELRKE